MTVHCDLGTHEQRGARVHDSSPHAPRVSSPCVSSVSGSSTYGRCASHSAHSLPSHSASEVLATGLSLRCRRTALTPVQPCNCDELITSVPNSTTLEPPRAAPDVEDVAEEHPDLPAGLRAQHAGEHAAQGSGGLGAAKAAEQHPLLPHLLLERLQKVVHDTCDLSVKCKEAEAARMIGPQH